MEGTKKGTNTHNFSTLSKQLDMACNISSWKGEKEQVSNFLTLFPLWGFTFLLLVCAQHGQHAMTNFNENIKINFMAHETLSAKYRAWTSLDMLKEVKSVVCARPTSLIWNCFSYFSVFWMMRRMRHKCWKRKIHLKCRTCCSPFHAYANSVTRMRCVLITIKKFFYLFHFPILNRRRLSLSSSHQSTHPIKVISNSLQRDEDDDDEHMVEPSRLIWISTKRFFNLSCWRVVSILKDISSQPLRWSWL